MAELRSAKGLQIHQDLDLQRRSWEIERWAWVIMGLILFAVLLGGLGGTGPLSAKTTSNAGGTLRAEYERFPRLHVPTRLRLYVAPMPGGAETRLSFDRGFLDRYRVLHVLPEPKVVSMASDHVLLVFGSPPHAPLIVTLYLEPEHPGRLKAHVGINDQAALVLRQFIYP